MKRACIAALAACGFAAPAAFAAPGNNFIDGYGLYSDIDPDGPGSDDDIGVGVKGGFQVADQVYLTGEFQTVEYDDSNVDFDQIRLGAGFGPGMGPNSQGLYGRAEYINWDFGHGNDDDGVGGAIGYGILLNPQFRLHGEIGYAYLDDIDGPELLVGGTYRVAQNLGVFADYRAGFYDTDGGPDIDISDFRVGVRFTF